MIEDMPLDEPLLVARPVSGEAPVIFDSPHSGRDYPADFETCIDPLFLRRAEDAYVDELFAAAPEHGATLIAARFPRAYLDPNRAKDDIDPAIVSDGWPGTANPTLRSKRGTGLVWVTMHGVDRLYERDLKRREIAERIALCWQPYHDAMTAAFDDLHDRHGRVYHINCHSMRSYGNRVDPEAEVDRPDFVLGDRDGRTCESEFTNLIQSYLFSKNYSVSLNEPFKGVELVRRYSDPAVGRHSLQIEVNRKLYLDERAVALHGGFDGLKADIDGLIQCIVSYAMDGRG